MNTISQAAGFCKEAYLRGTQGSWSQPPLHFDSDEIFRAFADHVQRRERDPKSLTLAMGRSPHFHEDFEALPRRSDNDFAGFTRRISRDYSTIPFFLALHGLEKSSAAIWLKAREFAHSLLSDERVVPHQLYIAAFLSKGGSTPFGVHTDIYHNFTFILEGSKKIRVWPRDALEPLFPGLGRRARPRLTEYSNYLSSSHLLEGNSGDLFYWPDSYWHVGEEGEDFAVTVVVSLDMKPEPGNLMRVWEMQSNELGEEFVHKGYRLTPDGNLPPEFAPFVTESNRSMLVDNWLAHLSAFGFAVPIPLRDKDMDRNMDMSFVRCDPRFPILYRETERGLRIFANGYRFLLTENRKWRDVIDEMNQGKLIAKIDLPAELKPLIDKLLVVSAVLPSKGGEG